MSTASPLACTIGTVAARPRSCRQVHRAPATSASAVRLTRRGRLAVVVLLLAALSGVGSLVGHVAATAGAPATVRHVTVRPGETLWQLANRIDPHADPRVVVAQLEAVNHLSDGTVAAGQRLVISGVTG